MLPRLKKLYFLSLLFDFEVIIHDKVVEFIIQNGFILMRSLFFRLFYELCLFFFKRYRHFVQVKKHNAYNGG